MTTAEATLESQRTKLALKRDKRENLEKFFEGKSGKYLGEAIFWTGAIAGVAMLASGVGAPAAPFVIGGGFIIGKSVQKRAKKKGKERKKWEPRLREGKDKVRDALDKWLFEGATGLAVGAGITAVAASAIVYAGLPLAGALAAGGAMVIGTRHALKAPGRARERRRWEKKILEE